MASVGDIEIPVRITIPDTTALRCLRILAMWMDDNPDAAIIVDRERLETGGYRHKVFIDRNGGERKSAT